MLALALGAWGCSSTSLAPIPSGQFSGPKADEALGLRLAPSGLAFINQHWPLLAEALAPGGTMTVPLACTQQRFTLPVIGPTDVFVADQGGPTGGQNDGACDGRDMPAQVQAKVTGLWVVTHPPAQIELAFDLTLDTGKIFVTNPHTAFGLTCDLKCSLAFATGGHGPGDNALSLGVRLLIDTTWDRLLTFEVDSIGGAKICGATGAGSPPGCLDPMDLSMSDEGSCLAFGWACDLLNVEAVKTFVFQQLSPALEASLTSLMTNQRCRPCSALGASCPVSTDGTGTASVCSQGLCVDPRGGCAPRLLGVEGRAGAQGSLAAGIDLSIAAGSTVTVDDGVTLGTRAGIEPVAKASCVPELDPPTAGSSRPADFGGEATGGLSYDLALSVSGAFLDRALWAAHQAGALCLTVDGQSTGGLDTSVVQAFLPSLGPLAVRDGRDAPMMLVLRPRAAPTMRVREGGVDAASGLSRPVLVVTLVDLAVDLYALIDDRMLRVLTVTSDVSAPVALSFPGCDRMKPELGQLELTNVRITDAEALAEDAQGLAALLPGLLALASPAIAQGLGELTLPMALGLRVEPLEAKGLGLVDPAQTTYAHLGLYARLLAPGDPSCAAH